MTDKVKVKLNFRTLVPGEGKKLLQETEKILNGNHNDAVKLSKLIYAVSQEARIYEAGDIVEVDWVLAQEWEQELMRVSFPVAGELKAYPDLPEPQPEYLKPRAERIA